MPRTPPSGARESNAGDDFHILWAAQRSLRLLDSRSDLKRVRLEGLAPEDAEAARQELLLGVDLTEYYGGDQWSTASRVVVSQLKYSTRHPEQAWTAARLSQHDKNRGRASVAKRLGEQFEAFSSTGDERRAKLRIHLVSNQPVSSKLRSSLNAAKGFLANATGTPTVEEICAGLPAPSRDEIATLYSGVGIDSGAFGEFLLILNLDHCGAGERTILEAELAAALRLHVNEEVEHGFNALYRRTLRECFPEASDSKGLTRADLLATFDVANEDDVFPAPSRVGMVSEPIPTADASRLADAIVAGSRRILAHGVAGVGKTTTLQALEAALPPHWSVVTYDCFGGGDYLSPADARHLPQRALLQITNELALRHRQPIVLRLPRDPADVWREFQRKVEVVAQELAPKNAGIVFAIDAADNAVHAGRVRSQATFVNEMWRLNLPSNVVVLMTTRTHRAPEVEPPEDAAWIALSGFALSASAVHLRRTFAEASASDCESFHEQTAGNPRLQFYLLSTIANRSEPLAAVLADAPRSPDELFRDIVDDAVERVAEPELAKRMLATMLAMSRPVRVATLADVCGVSLDTAERFCSGLEPGVRREESTVALRDEDFEAHLLERAAKDLKAAHDALGNYFGALEAEDADAAVEIAEHLKLAGRDAELVELALAKAPQAVEDPLRRFQTYQRRLELALGVAPPDGSAALKLLLLSAQAAGFDGAFATVIREQPDLAVRHGDARAAARIYLRQEHMGWQGPTHYRLAAMHSRAGAEELAREQLDLANAWVLRRQQEPERGRWEWRLSAEDIARGAEAVYWLDGAKAAADWLGRWRPADAVLEAAGHLAKRLASRVSPRRAERQLSTLGLAPRVEARFHAAMWEAGASTSAEAVAALAGRVTTELSAVPLESGDASWSIPFSELLASRPATRGDASVILEGTPLEMPAYAHTGSRGDFDSPLRRECLRAALAGKDLTPEELLPERLRAEAPSQPGTPTYQIEQERGKYLAVVRDLLLPASLRAEAILGRATLSRLRASVVPRLNQHQGMRGHRFRERSEGFNEWVRTFTDALARVRGSGESLLDDLANVAEDAILGSAPYAWLTMAEVLMPRQRYREFAVRLADRAAAFAEQHEQPASERMAVLLRAAEITDPWDAKAAAEFFQRAVVAAEGLDDEGAGVLDVHAMLARRAAGSLDDASAGSFGERLSAALERFEAHVSDTDLLPYGETLKSLAFLCPPGAMALASRWDDEMRLSLVQSVPDLTVALSQVGYIAPETAFWLLRLAGESEAVVRAALSHFGQLRAHGPPGRILLAKLVPELDLWIRRDLPLVERRRNAELLIHWLAANGLSPLAGPELKALLAVGKPAPSQRAGVRLVDNAGFGTVSDRGPYLVPSMDQLEEQLNELRARYAGGREIRELLEAAAGACPVSERVRFLETLGGLRGDDWILRFGSGELIGVITACLRTWRGSPAVGAWARSSMPSFLGRAIVAITKDQHHDEAVVGATLHQPGVLERVPEVILDAIHGRLHDLAPGHLYRLSRVVASSVTPASALEVLDWSLASQEDATPSAPRPLPTDTSESLASFLWALFGNPSRRVRWRALHAARAICKLEPTILESLMSRSHVADAGPFAPSEMTFYSISARVSVLTLTARLAYDHPDLVRPHVDALFTAAVDTSFPHVVVRELAKIAATSVVERYPETLDSEHTNRLAAANLPSASHVERGHRALRGRSSRQSGSERFRFDQMDTLPYWYEPLGSVLGLTVDDVASRAARWIVDMLGFSDDDWWHDRRETRSARNWEMMHNDHGSIPPVESLLKYLEFHGMLLAAGEAIDAGVPIAEQSWAESEGAWDSWLGSFLSPKQDRWMADLRSPAPVESWIYGPLGAIEEWCSPADGEFERHLWGSEDVDGFVTVAASLSLWEVDRDESTYVSSALVSPPAATALMRALQVSDAGSYWFPSEGDHDGRRQDRWEIALDGFQFLGWCEDVSFDDSRAEEHDPYRRIGRTFEIPGRSFRKTLQLTKDDSHLTLRTGSGDAVACTSLWSDEIERNRRHIEERQTDGWRTRVRVDDLLEFLRRRRLDLLIEVRIRRNKSGSPGRSDGYSDPVSRIYLLRRSGRLETMAKSGRSRSVNRGGARGR